MTLISSEEAIFAAAVKGKRPSLHLQRDLLVVEVGGWVVKWC